jgi:predicted metal-binding protein
VTHKKYDGHCIDDPIVQRPSGKVTYDRIPEPATMKPLEAYCERALEMGADARIIHPSSIATAEWVRMKCQFGCAGFGRSHCCPPHSPTPEVTRKVIDSYQKAVLLHKQPEKGARGKSFNETLVSLETEIFLDGRYKAWSMGSGPCRFCEECDLARPCKQGYRARPSMEACGIDVFKTARENGFRIEVLKTRGEEKNLFGIILAE